MPESDARSVISTQTFQRALTVSVHGQLRGDKDFPFSGVTNSGRVWRKVPESDARCVILPILSYMFVSVLMMCLFVA